VEKAVKVELALVEADQARRDAILTTAVLRASKLLQVNNRELAAIIGVSPSMVSKLQAGRAVLRQSDKSGELAAQFIRLFRSLDAIVGGDTTTARDWLHNHNTALLAAPIDHIKTVVGLIDTVDYLDQRRAPL